MIAAPIGIQRREIVACPDFETVFGGVHGDIHATQILGDGFNAIGFFTRSSAASRRRDLLRSARPGWTGRNFVDHGGGSWAFDDTARMREVFTCRLPIFLRYLFDMQELDARAHARST